MQWRAIAGSWVLNPKRAKGVVHFLGGAFVGSAPQLVYDYLLQQLASAGFAVVATPYTTIPDHRETAIAALRSLQQVLPQLDAISIPRFGLGHSLGCKLHLLGSCWEQSDPWQKSLPPRQGNILMAYSNASLRRSIPAADWVLPPVEFEPSPTATERLIDHSYPVAQTLLVKFNRDDIDDIASLHRQLISKFGSAVRYFTLAGDHGTSAAGANPFVPQTDFSPLDVIGQFLYQSTHREIQQLSKVLLQWLEHQLASVN
jgi:hypothetical protein